MNFRIDWNVIPATGGTIVLPRSLSFYNIYDDVVITIYKFQKRLIDIFGALLGLLLLFPVMSLIAIVVKITSPGPILFKQKRLGFQGKEFTFLKFRTMYCDSDDQIHRDYIKKFLEGNEDDTNLGTIEKPLYKSCEP